MSVYRQLWQLFESVRQHFTSPSAGNPGPNRGADALNAATQKAVIDSVKAALGNTNDPALQQHQQQQQGNSRECPAPQQPQCSTDKRHRPKSSGNKVSQVSSRDAGNENACQPSVCQGSAETPVQGESDTSPKLHQRPVDIWAAKQRPDALSQRTCPVFGHPAVQELSLCHLLDVHDDHSCRTRAECGVDSVTCRARECSVHSFCQEAAR